MLDEDEKYFKKHGEPLFSSHMIDLSEEEKFENIETTKKYLQRAAPMKQWLEMVSDSRCSVGSGLVLRTSGNRYHRGGRGWCRQHWRR
jgi:hypothetical protein